VFLALLLFHWSSENVAPASLSARTCVIVYFASKSHRSVTGRPERPPPADTGLLFCFWWLSSGCGGGFAEKFAENTYRDSHRWIISFREVVLSDKLFPLFLKCHPAESKTQKPYNARAKHAFGTERCRRWNSYLLRLLVAQ